MTALALTSCGRAPVAEADAAIVHASVIPMTRDTVLAGHTVLVRDGRISDIVRDGAVTLAEGTMTIDAGGMYLMPGLVDGHAHLRAREDMELFLARGFTTVRNMHGGLGDPLVWQREIDAGVLVGPSLINASPVLQWQSEGFTLPGRGPITSVDTLKAFVREIADSGYASVKIMPFPREAFDTLMVEASRVGLPVSGHVPITETGDPGQDLTWDEVLSSGMLAIEHLGDLITRGLGPGALDTISSADLAGRVAASGIAVVTSAGMTQVVTTGLELDTAYVTEELRGRALKYGGEEGLARLYALPRMWRENGFIPIDPELLTVFARQLHTAGVPLVVGTDAHNPLAVAGESAVDEMLFLHASGLTPFEALQAMTSVPAEVLGARGQWGTVEIGARADLLLLEANPLVDPSAVRSVASVMVRGQWLDGSRLAAMR